MNIYLKRGIIIFLLMSFIVTYLIENLYKNGFKPTFSGIYEKTVIIDPGHGEPDGGTTGVSGVSESKINLEISEKISAKLNKKCYNVVMTRETEEGIYSKGKSIKEKKLSDMHNREELLNGLDADLFLSIHLNFFSDPSVFGAQVFYSKNKEESKEVAEAIRRSLIKLDERNNRILKKADKGIYLMEKAQIPACLVECGFLSNPTDDENLRNEEYQEKLADAIVLGIENYFNGGKYE